MAIKKYVADADNTIVNAYQPNMQTRGTGSNMGRSDVVEVFSVYGRQQQSSSTRKASQELSRVLMKFPVDSISTDRSNSVIPASGSVSFYLRLYNAEHTRTVPQDLVLMVHAVSRSWQEGIGLDMVNYDDLTKDQYPGSNWMSASNSEAWTLVGGDYISASSQWNLGGTPPNYSQSFSTGLEDLEIDISSLVEHWLASDLNNYGVGILLTSSQEAYYSSSDGAPADGASLNITGGAQRSWYTKRFFARGTQFFYKRPVIEARWNSTKRDDRGQFNYSSSLAPAADNLNTLYFYNYVRGRLRNIPAVGSTGSIMLSLYSGSADNSAPSGSKLILSDGTTAITGGWVSTGIYSASICITAAATPVKTLYDVWWSGSGDDPPTNVIEFATSSIAASKMVVINHSRHPTYYMNITNLRNKYSTSETARFNLYVRDKNWNPTIYTKANTTPPSTSIMSASYRVFRLVDGLEAIPYGTGSNFETGLSYDVSGNYFDLDMSALDGGYAYGLKFSFYDPEMSTWTEQDKVFKFRVEDYEY
jgi:hypothetical protein